MQLASVCSSAKNAPVNFLLRIATPSSGRGNRGQGIVKRDTVRARTFAAAVADDDL